MLILKALLAWLVILVLAIANGLVRLTRATPAQGMRIGAGWHGT